MMPESARPTDGARVRRFRVLRGACAAAVSLLITAACAGQETEPAGTPALRRLIHQFDFDERKDGNFETLPMHWAKVGAEGFPGFAEGTLDQGVGRTAPPSFHLNANGRNVAYWYQGPAAAVRPNSEHLVVGYVRADRMTSTRACLSAYYLDRNRLPIAGTQVFSRLVGSEADGKPWQKVEIHLPTAPRGGESIGLTAWVVQAQVWDPRARPHRHIELSDVGGGAWFDDITTYRLPSAVLSTDAPGNVFVAPQQPFFTVAVADTDAVGMTASLEIRSAAGDVVYRRPVQVQTTEYILPESVHLASLSPGLYEAVLSVRAGRSTSLTRCIRFAQLAASSNPGIGTARHFGVSLDAKGPLDPRTALAMLKTLGVGAVKIPVWGRSALAQTPGQDGFGPDDLLHELVKARVTLTGVLSAPPPELVESAGSFARSLLDLLSDDPAGWRSHLAAVVAPYASVFRTWQLGADGDRTAMNHPELRDALQNVRDEMTPLINTVDLATPGDGGAATEGLTLPVDEISLLIPRDVQDEWIPAYLAEYRRQDYRWLSGYIEMGSESSFARLPFLAEFAQKVVRTRHAGVTTTYVPQLWHSRSTLMGTVTEPDESFILYRTIIDLLGDRTPGPQLTLAPGVKTCAFHDVDDSVLVLWDESAPPDGRLHELQLGSAHYQTDAWGRQMPLQRTPDGLHRVRVFREPIFIDGVERWLVDFITAIRIDPPKVELSLLPQKHIIKLANTETKPRSGRLTLQTPERWEVQPSEFAFHLAPQYTFEQPVEIRYGHNEPAGIKVIRALIEFEGQPPMKLTVPLTVELGISDVDVWGFALFEGDRLILRHGITNRANTALSFRSSATCPGRRRQFRVITSLPPGGTTTAEYHFDHADALSGRTVRLGLREVNGHRNHSTELIAP